MPSPNFRGETPTGAGGAYALTGSDQLFFSSSFFFCFFFMERIGLGGEVVPCVHEGVVASAAWDSGSAGRGLRWALHLATERGGLEMRVLR